MLKKILIGITALAVLLIVAVVALLTLVDFDRFKPRIEQLAHDELGRTLRFDGKLSLSVFPNIAVALPRTTLSEHGSDQTFLSLERARVSLALLPLLSGRLQAGTASLYGLRASFDRRADGTTSLDDLTGAGKPKAGGEAPAPAASAASAPLFELGGIELVDAQLVYRDEKSHNTVTVSKLNLKAGRLATRSSTPLDLSASIDATEPKTHLDVALKTTLELDLARKAIGVRGLDAQVRGNLADDRLDIALAAPLLELGPAHVAGDSLKLVAAVTGAHTAKAELALEKLSGNGEQISAAQITLDLQSGQGPQEVSARIVGPLQVGVSAQSVELTRLTGTLDLQSPSLPQKALKVRLDGTLRFEAKAQNIGTKMNAHFDETNAAARIAVQGFTSPHIAFDIDVDRIDLDRYLPPAPPDAGARPAAASAAPAGTADPKVDLSALKALNLAGEASIGSLQVHKLKGTHIKVGVHAAGGHLTVGPLAALLYEGAMTGSVKVDADVNRVGANLALDSISIEPLLKDLTGKDVLEGHGNVRLDVSTLGATVGAMRRSLAGTASLALKDGAVHGINVAQKLRDLKSTLAGAPAQAQAADSSQKTDFSELTASFKIVNGVATNRDLSGKSPLLRLTGSGSIDLGAGALDYTAQASVVGTLAGQGGGDLPDLRGVTVPVHMTGPFSALSYQLDWGAIARQAVAKKAGEQLKNLLQNKLNSNGQAPSGLGDALKGLLRK